MENEPQGVTIEVSPPHVRKSQALKDAVINEVLATGNIAGTAQKYGLSRRTLHYWIAESMKERRETRDIVFINQMEVIVNKMLAELNIKDMEQTSIRDLTVSLGILLDKRAALLGPKQEASNVINLKVAWKDGTGAVELTTNSRTSLPTIPRTPGEVVDGVVYEPLETGDDDPTVWGDDQGD